MKQKVFLLLLVSVLMGKQMIAQTEPRIQPVWWFGESGAANFNFYRGTTQAINNELMVPTAFHKGYAVKPYASVLIEYRPSKIWGAMLNVAYDNRGGKFDSVMAPCNCPANLSTNISYVTIEPSIRINPVPSIPFYIFGGPVISFVAQKDFVYAQDQQMVKRGDWSDIRTTTFSFQAGAGVDIAVSKRAARTQLVIAPFASMQSDIGRDPRTTGSWKVYSLRAGVAVKIGVSKKKIPVITKTEIVDRIVNIHDTITVTNTITLPGSVTALRNDKATAATAPVSNTGYATGETGETFPLLNTVFFEQGSTGIPSRYNLLDQKEASAFSEAALVSAHPGYLDNQRSVRQLTVYHNILNIIGTRMQKTRAVITLTGFGSTSAEGLEMASNMKNYLTQHFDINASRIETRSEIKAGISKDPMLVAEQRKVVIASADETVLQQVSDNTANNELKNNNARFSVLFEFDRSLTVYDNEQFLIRKIVPLINSNATIIIHGHTDHSGDSKHNLLLSGNRAHGIEHILERAVAKAGKTNVQFEVYGFGELAGVIPFKNSLPEESYYNRTVTIDVIPLK